jgi:hypothetical protein
MAQELLATLVMSHRAKQRETGYHICITVSPRPTTRTFSTFSATDDRTAK